MPATEGFDPCVCVCYRVSCAGHVPRLWSTVLPSRPPTCPIPPCLIRLLYRTNPQSCTYGSTARTWGVDTMRRLMVGRVGAASLWVHSRVAAPGKASTGASGGPLAAVQPAGSFDGR